jgi:Isochorismatase family
MPPSDLAQPGVPVIVLAADGVELILDVTGPRLPRVLHWGACPGPLTQLPPMAAVQDLVPSQGDGWFGRPVLSVCCESSARDASTLGYRVIMVADANAARRDQDHNATLYTIYRTFGDVRSAVDVIELIQRS